MPVVTNPGIIDPVKFADEVINVRIPNPFMPDTPQRIATDTSQKVGIRYGETIKAYVAKDGSAKSLTAIPLAIAGWCRYLLGVDDDGVAFELSPDPMAVELKEQIKGIIWGEPSSYTGQLKNPLTRGVRDQMIYVLKEERITPACAGSTKARSEYSILSEDHPRLRGEYEGS